MDKLDKSLWPTDPKLRAALERIKNTPWVIESSGTVRVPEWAKRTYTPLEAITLDLLTQPNEDNPEYTGGWFITREPEDK